MPKNSNKMPAGMTEAQEAAWYTTPEGERQTSREFRKAIKSGTAIFGDGKNNADVLMQLMDQAKERATQSISIRLPVADIERAKSIASKKGIGYQAVLKAAIHKAVRKAG